MLRVLYQKQSDWEAWPRSQVKLDWATGPSSLWSILITRPKSFVHYVDPTRITVKPCCLFSTGSGREPRGGEKTPTLPLKLFPRAFLFEAHLVFVFKSGRFSVLKTWCIRVTWYSEGVILRWNNVNSDLDGRWLAVHCLANQLVWYVRKSEQQVVQLNLKRPQMLGKERGRGTSWSGN